MATSMWLWYARWDLNPHALLQRFLRPPCLPIPSTGTYGLGDGTRTHNTGDLSPLPMPIRPRPDMAPEVGFEPTVSFPTAVFRTAVINHSTTLAYKKGGISAALMNVYLYVILFSTCYCPAWRITSGSIDIRNLIAQGFVNQRMLNFHPRELFRQLFR